MPNPIELAVALNVRNAHGTVAATVRRLWDGPPSRRRLRSDRSLAARPPDVLKKRAYTPAGLDQDVLGAGQSGAHEAFGRSAEPPSVGGASM